MLLLQLIYNTASLLGQDYELFLVFDEAKVSSTATHRTHNEVHQTIQAAGSLGNELRCLGLH